MPNEPDKSADPNASGPPDDSAGPNDPTQPGGSSDDDLIRRAMEQVGGTPGIKPASGSPGPGSGGSLSGDLSGVSPDVFPGYTLVREIHRGGQGVVYLAIQKSTKKKVAVKVLREGPFASSKDRVRFDREVEVLGQLNHPNIVAVQDSGSLPPDKGGLHYFVMDYISGRSLDSFLAQSNLKVEQVMGLFAKICDAVNAAHLKGVIHRDLKPSNIRVDASGEPHILDFGLAKVALSDASEEDPRQMVTMTGQFIGSLAWASPEQAEMSAGKIDTRTDVYSLGVMLYSALTGRFPYAVLGNMRDVLDNILRASPARPTSVQRRINDEVETIVLKCLSKERDRRYQNAGELARDLRNYLDGRPVEAKRDSWLYVLRKTLARRRALVAAAGLVLVALVGATVVSTAYWRRAEAQRRVADQARAIADAERTKAEEARTIAQREEAKARRAADFLKGVLRGADPTTFTADGPTSFLELLQMATAQAEVDLASEPLVLADVLQTIGSTYGSFSQNDIAEKRLRRSLELREKHLPAGHPEIARTLLALGRLRCDSNSPAEGWALYERARDMLKAARGTESSDYSDALLVMGIAKGMSKEHADGRALMEESLAIRVKVFGGDSVEAAEVLTSLADLEVAAGRPDEALAHLAKAHANVAVKIGQQNIMAATVKEQMAKAHLARGTPDDLERALVDVKDSLETKVKVLGELNPHHAQIATMHWRVAMALDALGRGLEGEPHLRASMTQFTHNGRPRSVGAAARDLGRLLRDAGGEARRADARDLLDRAAEIMRSIPTRDADVPPVLAAIAELERLSGARDKALARCDEVLESAGASPESLARAKVTRSRVLAEQGDSRGAAALAREVLAVQGLPPVVSSGAKVALGHAMLVGGDKAGALTALRETRESLTSKAAEPSRLAAEAAALLRQAEAR